MRVTMETILGEILEEYPGAEAVMKKYLGEAYCLTCPGKMFDTIGNGAMLHGMSGEEAANMLSDLQEVVDQYEAAHPETPAAQAADAAPETEKPE